MMTQLHIKSSVVVWSLFIMIVIFIALALCAALSPAQNIIVKSILSQFSLSAERTPPAFFSFLLLLICSIWLGVIALQEHQIGSRWYRHWAFLALMFLLMSYDEAAELHEKLIEPVRELLGVDGFFYYAWVIPGIVVAAIIFVAYLPFLLHLPRVFAGLFLLSGAIYVGGAIGLEMIGGKYLDEYGRDLIYRLTATLEEAFEMFGAWLFIYSLMKYLTRQAGAFGLKVELTEGATVPVRLKLGTARCRAWLGSPDARRLIAQPSFRRGRGGHPPASNGSSAVPWLRCQRD